MAFSPLRASHVDPFGSENLLLDDEKLHESVAMPVLIPRNAGKREGGSVHLVYRIIIPHSVCVDGEFSNQ